MGIDYNELLKHSELPNQDDDQLLLTLMRRIIDASWSDLTIWDNPTADTKEDRPYVLYVDETITITAAEYQQLINMGAARNIEDDE